MSSGSHLSKKFTLRFERLNVINYSNFAKRTDKYAMKIIFRPKILGTLLLGIFTLTTTSAAFADNVATSAPVSNAPATSASNSAPAKDPSAILTAPTHDNDDEAASNNDTSNQNNPTAKTTPVAAAPAASRQSQDAIGNMLLQSVSLMGIAYKWGGNTPTTGMDCSGFVRYVFKKSLGIDLPRTAAEMARVGKRVSIDQLQPGDLIFFNTRRGSNTHIGIYLGGNKFIQSPRTGENIQISDLSGYWAQHFNGAKRVVQETSDSDGDTSLQNFQNVRDEALPVARRAYSKKGRHSSRHSVRTSSRKGNHATVVKTKSTTKAKTKSRKKKH